MSADAGRVAPVLTPYQARFLMCPLLSQPLEGGGIQRVACQAGQCTLWDWLIPEGQGCAGVGKCSIPRRAYAYAEAVRERAKQKAQRGRAA